MAAIAASGLALTAATAEETPTRQHAPADSTFSIIGRAIKDLHAYLTKYRSQDLIII
jgi:hypothetical protein